MAERLTPPSGWTVSEVHGSRGWGRSPRWQAQGPGGGIVGGFDTKAEAITFAHQAEARAQPASSALSTPAPIIIDQATRLDLHVGDTLVIHTDRRMTDGEYEEVSRRMRAELPGVRVLFLEGFRVDAVLAGAPRPDPAEDEPAPEASGT